MSVFPPKVVAAFDPKQTLDRQRINGSNGWKADAWAICAIDFALQED